MIINGRINLLISAEKTVIELIDEDSITTFARFVLNPEQLSMALARHGHCDVTSAEVFSLEKVGKIHENKSFEFELPEWYNHYKQDKPKLAEYCNSLLNDGWVTSDSFSSQNSFFSKDGKSYGRATIRRWIDKTVI